MRLIEARHTRSLESRLQYAHLDHATDPTHDLGLDTPAPRAAADPGHSDADPDHSDADDEASRYETDLLALAALADPAGPTGIVGGPGPASDAPDPGLEAELAGFAALLANHPTSPDADTAPDTEPRTAPDGQDTTRNDDAQEAS